MREKKWKIGKYKKLREKKCGNLAKKSFDKNGPFFSNNFSPDFPLFFLRKTGKAGKAGNTFKVWKFNRGQNIWNASHFNIWEKNGKNGNTKKLRKKMWKFKQNVYR